LSSTTIANPTANPTTTTTYTLTITDEHGCNSTDDVTITVDPAPVADAGADDVICQGNSTSLDASSSTGTNITYSWAPATGLSSTSIANPNANPTTTTTYTLTITDEHGCTSTDDVTITVNQTAVADAGSDDDVCEGNDYTFNGSASNYTSILWTTSGDGTFTGETTLTPTYSPGANDISNGTVTITLEASSTAPCPVNTDDVVLTILPKPTTSPIYHF